MSIDGALLERIKALDAVQQKLVSDYVDELMSAPDEWEIARGREWYIAEVDKALEGLSAGHVVDFDEGIDGVLEKLGL